MFLDFILRRNKPKKKTGKWSPDVQMLHLDFFCHLTYLAAIATSGISRSGLFLYAARMPLMTAPYFRRINVVARAFNHDYSESCRIVGEETKETEVKALLLRLSGALSSGEDLASFLEKEAEVAAEKYSEHYLAGLDSLKKWTDAYVALIMTAAIVVVMTVVTLIMGSGDSTFMLGFGTLTVLVTLVGVWLIYTSAPRENKNHSLPVGSREQNMGRFLFRYLLPISIGAAIVTVAVGLPLGVVLLCTGVILFPIGVVAIRDDGKMTQYETDVSGLLRSLGGVTQATNITINEALSRLDFRSLVSLKDGVTLLYTRIHAGLDPRVCWDRLVAETGSELVVRSVRVFLDSIAIGGQPERVGREAGSFAMRIALLRNKRATIAAGLLWLVGIMHVILVALVLFISESMSQFTRLIESIMPEGGATVVPGMSSFGIFSTGSSEMGLLGFMVTGIVMVLTVANSVAIYAAGGGHHYKVLYYLSLMMSASGGLFLAIPKLVDLMFTNLA